MTKKIAITGATGFIGTALVEYLRQHTDFHITALVRDYSKCARIARHNIEMKTYHWSDANQLTNLLKGYDYVVHCAFDPGSVANNLKAAQALATACIANKTKLVHLSSISVYEPLHGDELSEEKVPEESKLPYPYAKQQIEKEILKYVSQGLELSVLLPTIVYGPFSKPWTIKPCKDLMSGKVILPDGGKGVCNPVHIDDVCQAIFKACLTKHKSGERFLISGPDFVTWDEFYKSFQVQLKTGGIEHISYEAIRKKLSNPISYLKLALVNPKLILQIPLIRALAVYCYRRFQKVINLDKIRALYRGYRSVAPELKHFPNKQLLELYHAPTKVDISKAQKLLGYEPRYSFAQGMQNTGKFVRWYFGHP